MADNYLEKRMADYRSGSLSRPSRPKAGSGGLRCIKIPPVMVLVLDATAGQTLLLTALREAGYRVAFTALPGTDGARLAQLTGTRHYPCTASEAIATLTAAGEAPAALVAADQATLDAAAQTAAPGVAEAPMRLILLEPGESPGRQALLCIARALP